MATNNAINQSCKVTQFTVSGTWTKDTRTQSVLIVAWGGGSGGGSGRRGITNVAGGGGGGSPSGYLFHQIPAAFFGTSATVTIGAGGAGGAGQTVNNTNGNDGTLGGVTSIGHTQTFSDAVTYGLGGNTSVAAGGAVTQVRGAYATSTSTTSAGSGHTSVGDDAPVSGGTSPEDTIFMQGTGGGGGSGANSAAAQGAGNGGFVKSIADDTLVAGGLGGLSGFTIDGGVGNDAANSSLAGGLWTGGSGGGGGGGQSLAGGSVAGVGGVGGNPGGGGGGGGGSITGTLSGAGGDGGRGELWVIEFF